MAKGEGRSRAEGRPALRVEARDDREVEAVLVVRHPLPGDLDRNGAHARDAAQLADRVPVDHLFLRFFTENHVYYN